MDILIENGDFKKDVQGMPVKIYGAEEACQRAALQFSTLKGTFVYNRELGTEWFAYGGPDCWSHERFMLVCREALAGYEGVELVDVSFEHGAYVSIVNFTVRYRGETVTSEVKLYEILR